jgi:hypothetical protein
MTKRYRDDDCADPRAERREELPIPDLDALTPERKASPAECVEWRLVEWYDAVKAALGRDTYPHPSGVWLNPADQRRLRRWVEIPIRSKAASGRRMALAMFWLDKGPSTSELVPLGQLIITGRAYDGADR